MAAGVAGDLQPDGGGRGAGRHCHSALSLAAIGCHSSEINTVILLSRWSVSAKMTASSSARRTARRAGCPTEDRACRCRASRCTTSATAAATSHTTSTSSPSASPTRRRPAAGSAAIQTYCHSDVSYYIPFTITHPTNTEGHLNGSSTRGQVAREWWRSHIGLRRSVRVQLAADALAAWAQLDRTTGAGALSHGAALSFWQKTTGMTARFLRESLRHGSR